LSPIAGYRLPFEVQPDQIKATTRDDVLEVRIPRPAERRAEAKKIPVA
jgi:HSP20 family molecular chaperone IbpA